MTQYKNLGNNSSIRAYEYDATGIRIQFNDGSTYEYTAASLGEPLLQEMKRLADVGQGLCSYINRNKNIRLGYSRKI